MPWTEHSVMNQRTEFVLRVMRGTEQFTDICQEFGISRKTGYKWKERFLKDGLTGLTDQSRRPVQSPLEVPEKMVCQIVKLKGAHAGWGARKLRAILARTTSPEELPSESSFKRILDRAGLVRHRRMIRTEQTGRLQTPVKSERPNHIWTIDFKGWWYTRNKARFEPLTIRDDFSRYLLCAQSLENARTESVREQMSRVFERFGLPEVIRSDNGAPFAARKSPLGLSRLSAWWLSLGIDLDRIQPGRPDQNGGHERMHRDLAGEVESCTEQDAATQQAALDVWRQTFNEERPHEALAMRMPHELYVPSSRRFDRTPMELTYPQGYLVRKVNGAGEVKIHGQRTFVSQALQGLEVGLQPSATDSHIMSLWFCRLCLGEVDLNTQKLQVIVTRQSIQVPNSNQKKEGQGK